MTSFEESREGGCNADPEAVSGGLFVLLAVESTPGLVAGMDAEAVADLSIRAV